MFGSPPELRYFSDTSLEQIKFIFQGFNHLKERKINNIKQATGENPVILSLMFINSNHLP